MLLDFDNGESLRNGTRVRDVSGRRHWATVVTQARGRVAKVKGIHKRGADFPNHCARCGRAILEVKDHPGLDPARRAFSFGAAVRLPAGLAQHAVNVVQKGFFDQSGGQYKLQLGPGGVPSCVLSGRAGRVQVVASASVADNRWHRLACVRTPTSVQLRVDGRVRATQSGVVGWVANAAPIRIGAKKVNPRNQQFHGRLDSVFVRIAPKR
jgi:hypothetical protein